MKDTTIDQNSAAPEMTSARHVVTVRDLIVRVYRRLLLVVICILLSCASAVFYLANSKPLYTATMTVAPPAQTGSATSSQLGQAFSAFGLSSILGNSTPQSFDLYQNLLPSLTVLQRVEDRHHIIRQVFADRWDVVRQTWRPAMGLRAEVRDFIYRIIGRDIPSPEPKIQDLVDYVRRHLSVDSVSLNSPVRVVSFTFTDPKVAADILRWLHEETDAVVRGNTRERTDGMIAYLRNQLPRVSNNDERNALTQLLTEQEQVLMLLTVGVDYSAVVVDPAVPPIVPSVSVEMVLIISFLVGLMLGVIIAIVIPSSRRRRAGMFGHDSRVHGDTLRGGQIASRIEPTGELP